MEYTLNHPWELGLLLGVALAFVLDLGWRTALHYHIDQATPRKEQMGTIRDGLFILVSLLLGFTLSMAVSRYAERRSLVVEEAMKDSHQQMPVTRPAHCFKDVRQHILRQRPF
jgi:hypothetical protein